MNISGLLGDVYESAGREAVTDLPVTHAEVPPAGGPEHGPTEAANPGSAPGGLPAAAGEPGPISESILEARGAEQRAARLRAEEAAKVAGSEPAPVALPSELRHQLHDDDLLPHRVGRRLKLRLR